MVEPATPSREYSPPRCSCPRPLSSPTRWTYDDPDRWSPGTPLEDGSWSRRRSSEPLRADSVRGHEGPTPPAQEDSDEDHDTRLIQRLLREHGPSLLQAYRDPDVDFEQVLLEMFSRTTSDRA